MILDCVRESAATRSLERRERVQCLTKQEAAPILTRLQAYQLWLEKRDSNGIYSRVPSRGYREASAASILRAFFSRVFELYSDGMYYVLISHSGRHDYATRGVRRTRTTKGPSRRCRRRADVTTVLWHVKSSKCRYYSRLFLFFFFFFSLALRSSRFVFRSRIVFFLL